MKRPTFQRRWTALAAWLVGVALCCIVIGRTTFTADLSAFLPQSPTKEQQVLLDQLRDGVVSRLILIGIEGGNAPLRAGLSKEVAKRLRADPEFVTVNNGEPVNADRDQAYLFGNRYLLSPAVRPDRFTVAGLHDAISDTIDLLTSPAGMMIKPLVPRDPTGEVVQLFDRMSGGNQPQMNNGAWAARDGTRALLLVQTRALGGDTDGQQQAMQRIQHAFDAAIKQQPPAASSALPLVAAGSAQPTAGSAELAGKATPPPTGVKLVMTGPGVFAVLSRQTIESEVKLLSIISIAIIITMLFVVYRSLTALALGLLPVVSGALVGVVAVSLGFGVVHGITLGFGTTLIGESVDYSIYLFVQSRQFSAGSRRGSGDWIADFWPTIRLGVLTSITGFACLLLSSFPGLAQLGLYSISGLVAAAAVTRYVLPHLLPDNFQIRDVSSIGNRLSGLAQRASVLRWPVAVLIVAACAVLVYHRDTLLNPELSGLNPVPQTVQADDARLRSDMGAPDVRYMVVVSAPDQESVLQSAEKVAEQLQPLVDKGVLAAFSSPTQYLPSIATQRARQASLPSGDLEQRLAQATKGLPVRAGVFAPFVADVAAAKNRTPLQRADLDNTSLALAVDSQLFQRGTRWNAVLSLTAARAGDTSSGIAVEPVRAAIAAAGQQNAVFVDLRAESGHLYSGYLREASILSLAGLGGIVLMLLLSLRAPAQVIRVMLPLVGAVVTVVAALALCDHRLTIMHLVGLLLIVAVGSNYALFFAKPRDSKGNHAGGITPQTLTSLFFANLTTVAGFGILAFSQVPVLQAIGITVGPGAVLALLFSAIFAGHRSAGSSVASTR
ncbi:MAG TPA: MMPL family transporter [Burkholderiaceae bacterium]|jgi:predicted exporter|nr:MMPL family transporter [Burkholderiaceae bacterium]